MFKKLLVVLLALTLIMGGTLTSFADKDEEFIKKVEGYGFDYTFEKYLKILPFTLDEKDLVKAKSLFNDIGYAFFKKDLDKVGIHLDAFYKIISKYWMSEKTLKTLLPLQDMLKESGMLITPDAVRSLENKFSLLTDYRRKGKFEDYFELVGDLHGEFYDLLATSVGDMHNELQLVQYIKGADKLTISDLANYSFKDYLSILPFTISDNDYLKGKAIFDGIIVTLRRDLKADVSSNIKDLNKILVPYWVKEKTLKTLVPHEENQTKAIHYFSRKGQLAMHDAYEEVVKAHQEVNNAKSKEKARLAFDRYFDTIDHYYHEFSKQIREYYGDFFDEIVFIRS